jgi:Fur family transcriptional regulator, iron response regulator
MHRTSPDKGALGELLQAHGIQPTQQRIEIAQILLSRPQHLSAEQVMAMVNQDRTVVSKATVYNTLGLFAEKGLVREVIVDPAKVFYDPNTSQHYHFYNIDTGTLVDIDAHHIPLGDLPPLPRGTAPVGVDIIIRVRGKE